MTNLEAKKITNLTFDVAELLDTLLGTSISYHFQEESQYSDFTTTTPLEGHVEIMRIEKGLNVIIKNFETTVAFPSCNRCLAPFELEVAFEHSERQFHIKLPKHLEDPEDFFMVDLKHQQIDISEILRQEIILHFPTFLVCSNSCRGICDQCGINKNKETCQCQQTQVSNNPFSALKELI